MTEGGARLWKFTAPEDAWLPGPPIHDFTQPVLALDGHSVFAGTGIGESGDGAIHCVDAATGKALWASETVNSLSATPTLSQDGRELYIGSNAFFVDAFYAFATKDGALRWTFNITTLPTEVIGSAAVDSKSNVYFGNAAGVLFALQPPGRQCPGGSLQQCMSLCPGDPAAAYQACVRDCAARCGHPIYV